MTGAKHTLIEAEDFRLESGFTVKQAGWASGGGYVQHTSGSKAVMSTTVTGQAGTYDLAIAYFDENDGNSTVTVKVDGVVVDTWTWDQDLGHHWANKTTKTTHVIENVTLTDSSVITIEGAGDGSEPLRIDALTLVPADATDGGVVDGGTTDGGTTGGTTDSGTTDGGTTDGGTTDGGTAESPADSGSPAPSPDGGLAFEGAQGFGAEATGGRGGEIVKVTNLNDSGVGSLRWALEDLSGPRIVVFEVGGEIALSSQIEINGDVTIAGQTAPGGITISGARLRVVESNVIIRGLHVRPGEDEGQDGGDRDAISIGKSGSTVENVIIDSNSFTWAVDETVATWGSPSNITISNNIIAEALESSIHPEGNHSMGMLIGDNTSNVTIVGNLFAHNQHRNAQIKDDAQNIEFVNNLIYNYGDNGFEGYGGNTVHIIGNHYIRGIDSASREPIRLNSPESGTAYYVYDNIGGVGGTALSDVASSPVFVSSGVAVMDSALVKDYVLATAGARTPELDAIDARIIQAVLDGTGSIIDSPDDVGGYLSYKAQAPLPDGDGDGIPDAYESVIGSDAGKFDAHGDADGDGYTNIEDYINGLIDGFDKAPSTSTSTSTTSPTSSLISSGTQTTTDGGSVSEPVGSTTSTAPFRVEAEDFKIEQGFEAVSNPHASGDVFLMAGDSGEQRASMVFGGPDGVYNLVLGYFDETDGVSQLEIRVNGVVVDKSIWDAASGSSLADMNSFAEREIAGVSLETGDVIELVGHGDGNEPLRTDYLDFAYVDQLL